jgi:proteasome assembly chaperone (PAC2) family protein
MAREEKLRDPWLVAVWPGMGGVAITAGYYLMAKLGMYLLVEFPATEIFETKEVEVKDGLILNRRLPRSRIFCWKDPQGQHDLILFIGEAQPPSGGSDFCMKLIEHARTLGVAKVFTFAALASHMRPKHDSRVFGAAIDQATLDQFKQLDVKVMEDGNISGLNGVLLGLAAGNGMSGGCLLGEIPVVFSQIPFPKAALNVLEFFTVMAGIELDFTELRIHADKVDMTLEDFMNRMELSDEESAAEPEELPDLLAGKSSQGVPPKNQQRIAQLFEQARSDRSQAYALKQELDRLGLFAEYEDRFLDLFKNPD